MTPFLVDFGNKIERTAEISDKEPEESGKAGVSVHLRPVHSSNIRVQALTTARLSYHVTNLCLFDDIPVVQSYFKNIRCVSIVTISNLFSHLLPDSWG
jgi:hypothetical protein